MSRQKHNHNTRYSLVIWWALLLACHVEPQSGLSKDCRASLHYRLTAVLLSLPVLVLHSSKKCKVMGFQAVSNAICS